jgi:hypothetical protein
VKYILDKAHNHGKIYYLPVMLTRAWSLQPREEQRLQVFENRVLKEYYMDIRGRKWQEAGEDCKMNSLITCTLHQYY